MHHFQHNSKNLETYEVTLKGKKHIAEGTWAFIFEKPKGFHFKAGQHVRMTHKGISRFLSLASTPAESDITVAMRMTGSAFKKALERINVGEKVIMQIRQDSPHESFVLHDDASRPAVFLVGGIGIVPALSMIKDALARKLPHKIFLFYSNRRPKDAPFLDELQNLARQYPSFTLVATMTKPERSWPGETGYINEAMLTKYVGNLESPIYYIAGMSGMVSAMKKLLRDVGIKKNSIRAEDFSDFKMYLMTRLPLAWKTPVIILIILAAVFIHGAAGITTLPSYALIGLMLFLLHFKLMYIFGLSHNKYEK